MLRLSPEGPASSSPVAHMQVMPLVLLLGYLLKHNGIEAEFEV